MKQITVEHFEDSKTHFLDYRCKYGQPNDNVVIYQEIYYASTIRGIMVLRCINGKHEINIELRNIDVAKQIVEKFQDEER